MRAALLLTAALFAALTACLKAFDVPPDESGALESCCHGLGHCIAEGLLGRAQAAFLPEDSCEPALLCVPDALANDDGAGFASCRSLLDAEGRCVPDCLPAVAGGASALPDEGCPAHHVCAPCFDPLDGAPTGVCQLGADPGPTDEPVLFDECCMLDGEARGACVPAELAPPGAPASAAETCEGGDELCAPRAWLRDPLAGPTPCEAPSDSRQGACVLECLLPAELRDLAERDSCAEFERCVPCELGDEPTGVCF